MVVRENRIPLLGYRGMKQRHPPNAVRLQFLSQNDTAAGESSSGIGGHNSHVDGYQIAPGAVIQPELHCIAGCRGVALAVRSVEPPGSGFIVHEAVASFDIEKLDASLHRFAAPPARPGL